MHWNVDPIIIDLGFFSIRYYSLLWMVGLLFVYQRVVRFTKEEKLPATYPDRLFILMVVLIVLCAHFVHLIFYEPSSFIYNPIRIIQIGSGLASHGGMLGGILAVWIFAKNNNLKFYEIADLIISVSAFTGVCIRIGNFFNSEIIGRPTDLPIGIVFDRIDSLPRHPAQLYEAVGLLALFFIFYFMYKYKKNSFQPGFFLYSFLFCYFILRFLIEFVKDYQSEIENVEKYLTMGQWLSIPAIIISFILLMTKIKLNVEEPKHQKGRR